MSQQCCDLVLVIDGTRSMTPVIESVSPMTPSESISDEADRGQVNG